MNQYENKYETNLESINNTLKKLDTTIKDLINKSSEVRLKIEMLMKKVNLKLVDSTQLLQFQHTILINEINYLKNLKQILLSNINTQLYCLSENIAMMAMSVLNVYKDIPGNDMKHILITNKNDEFPKITAYISFNLNYVHDILENFKKYNDELFAERTWIWSEHYLEEMFQISAPPGKYYLRFELVQPCLAHLNVSNMRVIQGPGRMKSGGLLKIGASNESQ